VDIVALTKNLAANFRSVIEKAGLKLIVQADTIIQPIYVDKQMWEKIVFNLLSNAFKYTLEGSITVALSAENDFAVLKVTDTGAGIPENELPEMFERFHRVLNVRGRTYEGTGIGLSLVKELLKMHQGTIHVESKLNEGSVFTVRIPAGKKHIADHQILKTAIDSDEISSTIYVNEIETLFNTGNKEIVKTSSAKEKTAFPIVLVVDDNADMRDHISSILSNSFDVITANNGMDALHKMKETIPALVLSDIMMPVMDGIGLLKEIKGNKSTANIPVILLTARAGEESRIEGWETGAEDYLVKPFSAKELLSRVQAQIKMEKLRLSLEGNMRNLFLNAPALICLLRGPQHVFELANDMYLELIGNRDILGKAIRKALPEVEGQGLFELLDNVYLTGEPFIGNEMPAQLDKGNGKLEEVYFNFVYQPSRNSEGIIDGILVHGVDVTEQVVSRKKIEENAKQQAFLLKLSDALRSLGNPVDIEEAVTKIALDFMDADWCHYVTLEEDNLIIQRGASRDGFASLAGVYPISSFTLFKDVLTTGIPSIINDVHTTDILDEDLKQLCIRLQNIAIVIVPVIKNGKPVGLLVLVQSKPRKWTDSEVQLTIETAERTWAAVERAKAEEALSKSEEKYRSLFNSIDEGVSTIEIIFDENEKAIDFRFLESNPAMTKATGLTSEIHGKTAKEVLPNLEEFWLETYGRVVITGEPIRFDYTSEDINSNWFEVHAYKVGNKQSRKIITVYNNITDRKIEEEKQTYILNLSDAIKELIDPVDIQLTACRILGEHLKVNRVLYGEVMDEEQIIINNNYVNGVAPINATLDAAQFGRNVIDAFKRNEKVIFSDINTDPGYTEEEKQSFLFLDVVANISIGLIKGGRWVATFGMHYNAPRNWTATEIWLLEETAERTWAAIERAKVEQALRKSEEKYRNLFTSIDQGFALCELVRNKEGKGIDFYVLEVNPSYEKQAGVNMEMVVGKTILQSFPALDKWWIETFTAIVNFHSPVVFEHYFESTHRWFAINAYPAEKDRFAILFSEITERKQAEAKIAESENRYHNMIYSSPSLIAIFKGEDMIIDIANDAILESWGKGKDIIGKTLISVMPEIVEQGFEEMLLNVYKTGEPFHAIEMPVTLIKSGKPELMHYTFVYQALYNAGGEIEGLAIIANEVTRQVELNKKIKESEQYFRQLTDTVPAIIWISEPDGSCTYLNKNWYSYTGQTKAEAKGFGWLDATHPDDKDERGRILLEANVQKKPFTASYRLKVKNGGYRWVIDRGSPKYGEDGMFKGMIGTVEDVHEEKLAAEKVRDSEKQFSTLANNIQNLAWIADGEGWIYWYNQRWYDYTGTTLEEMEGWGWQKVHHPDHVEGILEICKKLWITNAPFELTFPLRRYDGEYRWFLTRGAPISDENGKIISWIGTNTDIEEQKNFSEQLEEKVKERTIQLNKLNGNLEEKNIQLENMNKELEAFTYVSSHDLQEPLRKIQTFAGRIIATEKEQLSDTAKDYFTRMQDSATRMQTLIQDLLAFSRISTSERKFEKTDLSKIVEEVAAEFKEAMEEKNAIIISGEMCGANIIPFQFRQLMHNLIGNALKFSKQDVPSRIIINSEFVTGPNSPFANRDACHVSLSDNGIGFEKHFSEKIFGVFQRLHGKNKYAGTGIGLAIVKKIVDNHNGIITAEGELGKGAAFHIYFPD
ncbi:MAG: PAS domain S-box protein, partial [Ferruginibacter sp.]|nr:PAS domain S-box protein [Ferruginibacter sp.]